MTAADNLPPWPEPRDDARRLALEEHIEKVLAQAPRLTDDQRSRLAELLRPARQVEVTDGPAER
jgi:hypothetical protein